MPSTRKGQIEIGFNWIYVLIAGAVILLFFIGVVVKQKTVSEEELGAELVRVLESIFTGAGVAEKTKNVIDTSGLADYTLYFDCRNEQGEYGILGSSARAQIPIEPVFSPRQLKTTQLITWSLPYRLPFKVIDFLIVSSVNTKYYLLGSGTFAYEFLNATQGFSVEPIASVDDIRGPFEFQVRLIDLTGAAVTPNAQVPRPLEEMKDEAVTAVAFTGANLIDYYQKRGGTWMKQNARPVQIISVAKERDAAKYAAIFAADEELYTCNMQKAFARLVHLQGLYQDKLEELITYYQEHPELSLSGRCLNYLKDDVGNMKESLDKHGSSIAACLAAGEVYSECLVLAESARAVRDANRQLAEEGDCVALY